MEKVFPLLIQKKKKKKLDPLTPQLENSPTP